MILDRLSYWITIEKVFVSPLAATVNAPIPGFVLGPIFQAQGQILFPAPSLRLVLALLIPLSSQT